MKKYLGIIIFISLQVISIYSFTQFIGLASILGIWAVVYLYIFSSMFFKTTLHVGGIGATHKGDYDTVTSDLKGNEVYQSTKEPRYSLKYINTKWVYLAFSVTNAVICFILIKG